MQIVQIADVKSNCGKESPTSTHRNRHIAIKLCGSGSRQLECARLHHAALKRVKVKFRSFQTFQCDISSHLDALLQRACYPFHSTGRMFLHRVLSIDTFSYSGHEVVSLGLPSFVTFKLKSPQKIN